MADHLREDDQQRAFIARREQREKELARARTNLPEEDEGLAATAAAMLKLTGAKVTAKAVRERLVAQNRHHEANAERAKRYGYGR